MAILKSSPSDVEKEAVCVSNNTHKPNSSSTDKYPVKVVKKSEVDKMIAFISMWMVGMPYILTTNSGSLKVLIHPPSREVAMMWAHEAISNGAKRVDIKDSLVMAYYKTK